MNKGIFSAIALALLLMMSWPAGGTIAGQTKDELPLPTQKPSGGVLLAWVGDYMRTIRVVALSTARGVVIIDANLSRSADARIRQARVSRNPWSSIRITKTQPSSSNLTRKKNGLRQPDRTFFAFPKRRRR